MALTLYNTLTRKQEEFKALGDEVRIYTCGLTVQSEPHVGHIRAALVRDILMRWLGYLGYKVMALENFTDVDDKIIEKQKELGLDWRMIAQKHIDTYLWACDKLHIQRAAFYPRASQHIEEIIELVEKLIQKGFAYEKEGDVYFRVRKFPDYGRLSKKSIDDLMAGARIEPAEAKDDPLDFALWKAAKPGEPYWLSPWGKGRPGWHIECSAMSMRYLGETFDIHTGGEDLVFPHHENEIAQSIAATGKPFARYWLHNGWVTLTGEKMSKSTGHYSPIREVLENYSPNVVRLFMLKTHYRKQLEYAQARLDEARAAYATIRTFLDRYGEIPAVPKPLMLDEFTSAMDDDLNTSKALGVIYELINKGYQTDDTKCAASVVSYCSLLGFDIGTKKDESDESIEVLTKIIVEVKNKLQKDKRDDMVGAIEHDESAILEGLRKKSELNPRLIGLLLDIRNRFRKESNYGFADYIRNRLLEHEIIVDDQGLDKSTYHVEVK